MEPTDKRNCVLCACAWGRPDPYVAPCPNRDLTGRTANCPSPVGRSDEVVPSFFPLAYHPEFFDLKPDQRAEQAERWAIATIAAAGPQFERRIMAKKQELQSRAEAFAKLGETIDGAIATFADSYAGEQAGQMTASLTRTAAIGEIETALSQPVIKEEILGRIGKPNGFKTDGKEYKDDQIIAAVAGALVRGAVIDAGEFMIIRGYPFFHSGYYERLLRRLEVPTIVRVYQAEIEGNVARCSAVAQYTVDGETTTIRYQKDAKLAGSVVDTRIVVPLNQGQAEDAAMGKAKRRVFRDVYERLSNIPFADQNELEAGDEDAIDAESSPVEAGDQAAGPKVKPAEVFDDETAAKMREDRGYQEQVLSEYRANLQSAETPGRLQVIGEEIAEDKTLSVETKEKLKEAYRAWKAPE